MAAYSAGLGGRKLKKVNTFKDMSRNRPSSPRPRRQQSAFRNDLLETRPQQSAFRNDLLETGQRASSYPPGSGASMPGLGQPAMHEDAMRRMARYPGAGGGASSAGASLAGQRMGLERAQGAASVFDARGRAKADTAIASATGRAPIAGDPRVPAPPPSMFDQRRPQRSPFFGNVPDIPAPEAETEEEAEAQAGTGGGMSFGGLGALGGLKGFGAGLSGIKTNFTENDLSNLEPIDTDKAYRTRFGLNTIGSDLSDIGKGLGPSGTQRSPWFGPGGDPTPVEEGAEAEDRRTPEQRAEDEYNADQEEEEEEDGEIDWGDLGDATDPYGLGDVSGDISEGLERFGGLTGADTGEGPGIGGGGTGDDEGDGADSDIDDWFDQQMADHEAAWPGQEEKIKSQMARAMRRMADMQGGMGSSVAGGYSGAAAATVLGGIQVMSDALAAHQREGRNLQLAWMEKKSDRNFQREMAETDRQTRLMEALFQSGEEISPEMIDLITSGQGLDGLGGEGGGGEGGVPEGFTENDEGLYVNADGDYLMGDGGMGSTGQVQADPYAEDSESYQWYATTDREDETGGRSYQSGQLDDEYGYYRLDRETGEKIWWKVGYGTARYPGDRSFFHREWDSRYTNDRRADVINGNGPRSEWGEPSLKTERKGAMDYIKDKYHMLGGGDISPEEFEQNRRAIPYEIGYFISWYKTTTGGPPEWSEVEDHLLDVGMLDPDDIREEWGEEDEGREAVLSPSSPQS